MDTLKSKPLTAGGRCHIRRSESKVSHGNAGNEENEEIIYDQKMRFSFFHTFNRVPIFLEWVRPNSCG